RQTGTVCHPVGVSPWTWSKLHVSCLRPPRIPARRYTRIRYESLIYPLILSLPRSLLLSLRFRLQLPFCSVQPASLFSSLPLCLQNYFLWWSLPVLISFSPTHFIVAGQPTSGSRLVTHPLVYRPSNPTLPTTFSPSATPSTTKMGANLSNLKPNDTSKVVLSTGDFDTLAIRLPILWGGAIYVMFMIMATCMLADRWRGPRGDRSLSTASVVAAVVMSTAWPVVLAYLLFSG
ncbi:hypothetical protein BKA65DRAFT_575848, partial [Rhexocercosporidium sp. MPI-PUGE-AT-0058]